MSVVVQVRTAGRRWHYAIMLPCVSPADALIAAASRLTGAQLAELATATRKSIGPGPLAYLGLRGRPFAAVQVASAALESAGRGPMMAAKAPLLEDAVLNAAIGEATRAGRDGSGVLPAWGDYKAAVDSGDAQRKKQGFQSSRRTIRHSLGGPLYKRWLMASIGASWALMAILSWDLTTETGPYTLEQRAALTGPWERVAPLPSFAG